MITLGILCLLIVAGLLPSWAAPVNWYHTQSATGTENRTIISTKPILLSVAGACNYDTAAPRVAMVFDSATTTGDGANPIAWVSLAAAPATNAPTCQSFAMPRDGIKTSTGLEIVCSTTAKLLTADTTSGGACKFWVGE